MFVADFAFCCVCCFVASGIFIFVRVGFRFLFVLHFLRGIVWNLGGSWGIVVFPRGWLALYICNFAKSFGILGDQGEVVDFDCIS